MKQTLAKVQAGNLALGAQMVIADLDQFAAFLNPLEGGIARWKTSSEKAYGMTARQVYGALLANWTSRHKSRLGVKVNPLMLEARGHIMSSPLTRSLLAEEASWLHESYPPVDPARAVELRKKAIELLLADGRDQKFPMVARVSALKRAARNLTHATVNNPVEARKVVAELDGIIPKNVQPSVRAKILSDALGPALRVQRTAPARPKPKPIVVPEPTVNTPPLPLHGWLTTGGKPVDLSRGLVVLNIVADWSPPSIYYTTQTFEPVAAKYMKQGVRFVTIFTGKGSDQASARSRKGGWTHPVAQEVGGLVLKRLGLVSVPRTLILKDGKILVSGIPQYKVQEALEHLLARPLDPFHPGAKELVDRLHDTARIAPVTDGYLTRSFNNAEAAIAYEARASRPRSSRELATLLSPGGGQKEVEAAIDQELRHSRANRVPYRISFKPRSLSYNWKTGRITTSISSRTFFPMEPGYAVQLDNGDVLSQFTAQVDRKVLSYAVSTRTRTMVLEQGLFDMLPELRVEVHGHVIGTKTVNGKRALRFHIKKASFSHKKGTFLKREF